jgi:hypothetical protein
MRQKIEETISKLNEKDINTIIFEEPKASFENKLKLF